MGEDIDIRIPFEALETSEEDIFLEARYQGKPFSGIAFGDTPTEHFEYSYLEGFGQGRGISVYPNGRRWKEFFMEQGQMTEETVWNPDGALKKQYRLSPFLRQFFQQNGVLVYEKTDSHLKKWYETGALKQEINYEEKNMTYYAPDGTWVAKQQANAKTGYFVLTWDSLQFHNAYIQEHYMELLEDWEFYPYFIRWLPEEGKAAKPRFFGGGKRFASGEDSSEVGNLVGNIVCNMIGSDNLHIKYDGINLALQFHVTAALPLLELALKCDVKPASLYSVDGTGGQSCVFTIAQRAQTAIEALCPANAKS